MKNSSYYYKIVIEQMFMNKYSVLMAIYIKEKPSYFETAIESMLNQTIPPSNFVVVCDGSLTNELNQIIEKYEKNKIFQIIRLESNHGIGYAAKVGLLQCKYNYVLKMDSDDISLPNRAEIELKYLNEGYDVVGSYISEFENDNPNNITCIRKPPLSQEEIIKYAKLRSPFNQPSIAFNRDFIVSVGNYSDLRRSEDWDLWIRCIVNGAKMINIDQILVNMRINGETTSRRGGKDHKKCVMKVIKQMRQIKFISAFEYLKAKLYYQVYISAPRGFKRFLTKTFLREKVKNK